MHSVKLYNIAIKFLLTFCTLTRASIYPKYQEPRILCRLLSTNRRICFEDFHLNVPWIEAEQHCRNRNSSLAVLSNDTRHHLQSQLWHNFSDVQNTSRFWTVCRQSASCEYLYYDSAAEQWQQSATNCSQAFGFICQQVQSFNWAQGSNSTHIHPGRFFGKNTSLEFCKAACASRPACNAMDHSPNCWLGGNWSTRQNFKSFVGFSTQDMFVHVSDDYQTYHCTFSGNGNDIVIAILLASVFCVVAPILTTVACIWRRRRAGRKTNTAYMQKDTNIYVNGSSLSHSKDTGNSIQKVSPQVKSNVVGDSGIIYATVVPSTCPAADAFDDIELTLSAEPVIYASLQ